MADRENSPRPPADELLVRGGIPAEDPANQISIGSHSSLRNRSRPPIIL